jgi:hypothetical protein
MNIILNTKKVLLFATILLVSVIFLILLIKNISGTDSLHLKQKEEPDENLSGITEDIIISKSGFYPQDLWIDGNANLTIKNKTATRFSLIGYYPENFPDNSITVMINANESQTINMIPGNQFNIELDFENNLDAVCIDIKTEKAFIPIDEGWNNDIRKLGTTINSWSLSE